MLFDGFDFISGFEIRLTLLFEFTFIPQRFDHLLF
jgi:hypothetical protein